MSYPLPQRITLPPEVTDQRALRIMGGSRKGREALHEVVEHLEKWIEIETHNVDKLKEALANVSAILRGEVKA